MKHLIYTAPIATGLLLFAGAGIASADIATSNDATSDSTSYAGTSNDAVDHMAGDVHDGNLEAPATTGTLQVVGQAPVLDDDGNPVLDEEGNPVTRNVWGWVPFTTPNTLVIIHNP